MRLIDADALKETGKKWFIDERYYHPLEKPQIVEIKSIETSMVNPQCELKCLADATVSFSGTIDLPEESASALWAICEGLEIVEGE